MKMKTDSILVTELHVALHLTGINVAQQQLWLWLWITANPLAQGAGLKGNYTLLLDPEPRNGPLLHHAY